MTDTPSSPTRARLSPMHNVGRTALTQGLTIAVWVTLLVFALSLIFVPWTQSISGSGSVIAFAPLERRQTVEAPIAGRVQSWFVQEGDYVKKGEPIAKIADNDPEYMLRLQTEQDAAQSRIRAQELSINLTQSRIESQTMARDFAVDNATQKITVLGEKIRASRKSLDAAKAKARTATQNLDRRKTLHGRGLASRRDLELAQLSADTTQADLARAQAGLRGTLAEKKALLAERGKIKASYEASIDSTRSTLEKLRAERAKAQADLAKVQVRLARQAQMTINAPRDGTVLRFLAKEGAEMVKAGDPIIEFVPDATSRAVEIWVDGNDAPLMQPGLKARIQFEGWPALQFMGWPSVAIGSFPAKVEFVDAHGDERGFFRLVLTPVDDTWPNGSYLRQGVRAKGWILVNRVTLGYEAWRRMNGFPASLARPTHGGKASGKSAAAPKK